MAPTGRFALVWRALAPALLLALLLAAPAHALRVVSYNILNYPGPSGPARAPYYRTILAPLHADVLVTGEMSSPTSVTEFLSEVLDVMEPGQWAAATFVDGNDTDAGFFYKPLAVQFLGQDSFYPDAPANLRLVHVYHVRPAAYAAAAADLWVYAAHLKASDTSADEFKRYTEAIGLRGQMETSLPAGARALILGDMNFYRATDRGYKKFIQDTLGNVGRCYDLLPAGTWHDGAGFVTIHTQSPCLSGGAACASGAATGGLDDRFDFILPTYSLVVSQGLAVAPGTMAVVGNDGQHWNKNITDAPTIPEGAAYATALQLASDHLPVRLDLRLPARISTDATLAFGSVIVGAPAPSLDLAVSNPAVAPADSLHCSFAAPAGFGAPGPLAVTAGGSAPATITMSVGEVGTRSGSLVVSSDDLDHPTTLVDLSGAVVDHAQASLDSMAVVTEGTLDFGAHAGGEFAPLLAAVHNRGYNPLHARLSVGTAQITGGEGRFAIQNFTPSLVSGTAGRWSVQFDDAGAVPGSTYEAVLTFTSADEPVPGATAQADVHYQLIARVTGDFTAVEPRTPAFTRLYAPRPNPLTSGGTLRFDLARPTRARLEIFDLSGRRVALLADREYTPGTYNLPWDGRGESGGVPGSGLYFVRLTTRGLPSQTVRLAVIR